MHACTDPSPLTSSIPLFTRLHDPLFLSLSPIACSLVCRGALAWTCCQKQCRARILSAFLCGATFMGWFVLLYIVVPGMWMDIMKICPSSSRSMLHWHYYVRTSREMAPFCDKVNAPKYCLPALCKVPRDQIRIKRRKICRVTTYVSILQSALGQEWIKHKLRSPSKL